MSTSHVRSILVSGASIAGPALAYWLNRYGFAVTVIEKAGTVRGGGYPIDVRGNAMEVADRMGLAVPLEAAHIDSRLLTFVDDQGRPQVSVIPELITGGRIGRDVELPRGALTTLLYGLTRDTVNYRFNTSIAALTDTDQGVDVRFEDGTHDRFDLVIGADGLHSNTRKLVFGPEHLFDRHIGFCFAGFELPNTFGLVREAVMANRPGQAVTLYAPGASERAHVFFNLANAPLTPEQARDPGYQRQLVTEAFADWGWLVPDLLRALAVADDLYFDEIKQIKMPQYAKGRVVLVGDAAYAPSFLTGTGTSLGLVGAYVLASELALHADHSDAFAAYERVIRPFVAANHGLLEDGLANIIPTTQAAIALRNRTLIAAAAAAVQAPPAAGHVEHSMLDLSGYLDIGAE
jgi:2-polyprenyl-6-methoxyphenol hydroxylase-like FAD-dependent oxidoreductase